MPLLPRARLPLVVLAFLSLAPAYGRAQTSVVPALHGPVVTPRVVEFSALPRITAPYTGVVRAREESHNPEADEVMEALKRNPLALAPSQLGQLTIDARKPGFEMLAPTIGTGFEGITQAGWIPGEPTVAAGPVNIFTAGNVSVTVTNKDGSNRVETDGQAFFGIPAAEGPISDAQCYYDALRGRFVALCFTQGTSPTNFSNFYLGISKTNDARGAWWIYTFDMTKDGTTPTSNWSDYQALGISDDKLAMSGQQFSFSGDFYQYQKIRVIDRVLAYSGAPVGYVDFASFPVPPGGNAQDLFVTKVARNLTAGDNTIHCLCVRTNGGTRVTYRTVTGPPSAPVLSAGNLVTVGSYSVPPDAVQQGSAALVATNDCRPPDFYVRNGVLICAWHTSASIGGTVSAIRLFRMRTSDRAVLTDETFGASGSFCYYPAVTVDSVGTIFLGFDRSSSSEFPSAYATGKRRVDAAIQPSVLVKAGLTPTAQSRWGDYTGIDNDASASGPGGSTAWYAGQWTKGTNQFGTWINPLTFTYGQIAGSVLDDCDGATGTSADRSALGGVTLSLMQGVTTVATTVTDASGNFNFGYLETGAYDVVVTPPAGGAAVDAIPGSGGNSQARVNAGDVQVNLTNAQTSVTNQFLVTSPHPSPATASISPTSRTAGGPTFTLTVTGSSFSLCSVVQVNGGARATTFVDAAHVTASIPASDLIGAGTRSITVVTPAPGGGTSNPQTFTVTSGGDITPPTVTLTAPTGGESWDVGSVHAITWTAADNIGVAAVDLDYSTDGGASFPNSIAVGLTNTGTYAWTVPFVRSTTARIRVRAIDADGNAATDSSHANVTLAGWTVTATSGAHGSIAPSGAVVVADGATPSFTIAPATGYHVAGVLVDGVSVGAVTGYTFPAVHADHTIAASFAINTYTLTVATVGSGTVAKSPDQPSYDHGSSVSLTATPAAGWSFLGWSGDALGSANPLSLTMDGNKSVTATFYAHIYTWNQAGTAAWGTASNWTPARTAPATDDELIFSGGGSPTVTGVPTQTIGRLVISNGTSVALQSAATATLTLAGGAGVDLDIAAGATLRFNTASALTLALGSAATGSVSGTVSVTSGAHRMVALGLSALVFQNGSAITLGTGFSGNVFGTGVAPSALNSVVFQSGSRYIQSVGANPFGASAPSSVVTFQAGSRFRLDAALTPSFSGRTYADFEYNNPTTISVTGGSPFQVDSLIITTGTFNVSLTGGGSIRGNVNVPIGSTLAFNPSSATTYALAGSSPQSLKIAGSFSANTNATLAVNNPSGISLATDVTLADTLSFVSGVVTTGGNTLVIAPTGGVIGASQVNGYVNGNLRRNVPAGASSRTFAIGSGARYAPVTVAMTGAASAFDVTAATGTPDHAQIGTSDLDATRTANRTWTLAPLGGTGFTGYDATFSFAPADLDAAADPSTFVVRRYSGGWSSPTPGTRTATSTQATGVTGFGDFAVGNLVQYALGITTIGGGTVARAPDQPAYDNGTVVSLTATPAAGWVFTGWSGDASGASNPLGVTMDGPKAITATFADSARPAVTVTSPNGGESFGIGATATLTWTATDNAAVSLVDLLWSSTGPGGPFDAIATGLANTGTYDWTVTGPTTSAGIVEVVAHDAAGNAGSDVSDAPFAVTSAAAVTGPVVTRYELSVWPNPVRRQARFGFALPEAGSVRLSILDLQGREVRLVTNREYDAGRYEVDAASQGRQALGAGLYFARLQVAGRTIVRRFIVAR